jgi:hypothetical protein
MREPLPWLFRAIAHGGPSRQRRQLRNRGIPVEHMCHVLYDGCSRYVRVIDVIAHAPVVFIVMDDKPHGQLTAQDGPLHDSAQVPREGASGEWPRDLPLNHAVYLHEYESGRPEADILPVSRVRRSTRESWVRGRSLLPGRHRTKNGRAGGAAVNDRGPLLVLVP